MPCQQACRQGIDLTMNAKLLVQLFFDGFLAGLGSHGTPQTVWADRTRNWLRNDVSVSDWDLILITSFDRVSDEDNGTVTHQYMGSTLVAAGSRQRSGFVHTSPTDT